MEHRNQIAHLSESSVSFWSIYIKVNVKVIFSQCAVTPFAISSYKWVKLINPGDRPPYESISKECDVVSDH